MTRLHELRAAAMIGQIIPDDDIGRTKPSGCICGNPEGTNKECERCRLIAEIADLKRDLQTYRVAYRRMQDPKYVSSEDTKRESTWCNICFDFVCTCQATQQQRNDAMERGDELRDRAKDER